jgi:predicted DNA-binding transcriptional regulator YafY
MPTTHPDWGTLGVGEWICGQHVSQHITGKRQLMSLISRPQVNPDIFRKRHKLTLGVCTVGAVMNDTLMRQWAMLRAIPRHPRRLDAPTIHASLHNLGMAVSLRTVQRDLNTLAKTFPLDFDESKPQGWCWQEGVGQLEIPSMDAHAALTFSLVEQYMQNLLPRSTLRQLAPWFDAAQGVANSQASTLTKWRDKLRVVPGTLHKIPAPIDSDIQATIYNGLLDERQIEVTYRAITTGKEAKNYPVHPLGLVVMDQVVYLVCKVKDYQDARFLAMHRIDSAQLLEARAVKPAAFDIDEFILREFGIRVGTAPLKLVLRIRGVLAKYLADTPVAADQNMAPIDSEWTRVQVRVQDTIQLRTWLRSLGPDAVLEEPESLRAQLKGEWEELASLYGAQTSHRLK